VSFVCAVDRHAGENLLGFDDDDCEEYEDDDNFDNGRKLNSDLRVADSSNDRTVVKTAMYIDYNDDDDDDNIDVQVSDCEEISANKPPAAAADRQPSRQAVRKQQSIDINQQHRDDIAHLQICGPQKKRDHNSHNVDVYDAEDYADDDYQHMQFMATDQQHHSRFLKGQRASSPEQQPCQSFLLLLLLLLH